MKDPPRDGGAERDGVVLASGSTVQPERRIEELSAALEERSKELQEALEHQVATSEVLKVIGRSSFDLTTVLDMVLDAAARLGKADIGTLRHREGEIYRLAATYGCTPEWRADFERYSTRPDRGSVYGRTMIEGRTVYIPDVLADPEFTRHEAQKLMGFRGALGVPLLRQGEAIGALILFWFEPLSIGKRRIELLETFADQAVIAIESARQFSEIQEKSLQIESQAAKLGEWNQMLEARVAEQVDQLRKMSKLSQFLSPKISNLIMSGEADDPLSMRRAEITVVHVDLRGFTAFTETTDPEEVMAVLRQYHAELGKAITAYDGTIEHFSGDGAMILFNAPVPTTDHELHAIKMSLQIRASVGELCAGWRKSGYELGFGTGVAEGYATIGTLGFEERLDYTAIGPVCNLAARLCSEADDGQILISPRVFAKIETLVDVSPVGELALKGFHRPILVHNVEGLRSADLA